MQNRFNPDTQEKGLAHLCGTSRSPWAWCSRALHRDRQILCREHRRACSGHTDAAAARPPLPTHRLLLFPSCSSPGSYPRNNLQRAAMPEEGPKISGRGPKPCLRRKKTKKRKRKVSTLWCSLFNPIKSNIGQLCPFLLTWVKHLKSWLRFLYQWGWDRNIPGAESFPRNIGELKWSFNTLHLQYQGLVFFHN